MRNSKDDYGTATDAGYRGGGYLGGGWAGGEGPSPTVGRKNDHRPDEHIRQDVSDLLTIDDGVDATDIEVSVNECVVILDGTVSDRRAKRRAEEIAEMVHGVRDVLNNLRVAR